MQTSGGEIWVYRRTAPAGVDLVQTSTQDVPVVDPVSGEMRSRSEPVYSQEARQVEQELNLLMYDGKLMSWKARIRQGRKYVD